MDYDCIKIHFRLIVVDLFWQKELDADPKAIQEIEFFGQLKNTEGENADGTQSMFVLTILEKTKERWLKFSQGSTKLANMQLSKLKAAAKNKTGTT